MLTDSSDSQCNSYQTAIADALAVYVANIETLEMRRTPDADDLEYYADKIKQRGRSK